MSPQLGRIVLLIVGVVLFGYIAFTTHDLDNVKNGTFYRLCYFSLMLRGWAYIWFDLIKVFPAP